MKNIQERINKLVLKDTDKKIKKMEKLYPEYGIVTYKLNIDSLRQYFEKGFNIPDIVEYPFIIKKNTSDFYFDLNIFYTTLNFLFRTFILRKTKSGKFMDEFSKNIYTNHMENPLFLKFINTLEINTEDMNDYQKMKYILLSDLEYITKEEIINSLTPYIELGLIKETSNKQVYLLKFKSNLEDYYNFKHEGSNNKKLVEKKVRKIRSIIIKNKYTFIPNAVFDVDRIFFIQNKELVMVPQFLLFYRKKYDISGN